MLEEDLKKMRPKTLIGLGGGLYELFSELNESVGLSFEVLELFDRYEMKALIMTRSENFERHLNFLQSLKNKPIIIFSLFLWNRRMACEKYLYEGLSLNSFKKIFSKALSLDIVFYPMISPLIKGLNDDLENLLETLLSLKKLGLNYCLFNFFSPKKSGSFISQWNEEERKQHFFAISELLFKNGFKPYMNLIDLEPYLKTKDLASFYFLYLWYLDSFIDHGNNGKEAYRNLSYALDILGDELFEEKRKDDKLLSIQYVGEYTEKILLEDVVTKQFHSLKKKEKKLIESA